MTSGGIRRCLLLTAALLVSGIAQGQAKRLVLVKVDGLPGGRIEQLLERTDPQTGLSVLPWMHYIFVERGTWVRNFYVRGISLSAPSWSMLDTGQHLTIRGNAEFDRFIPRVYDYLNFFPFYRGYAELQRVDMPSVEVLDQFGIPLLLDQFPPEARYQSMQLFQRGVRWTTLKDSLANRVLRPARELVNEWETGFEMGAGIAHEQEKEIIAALADPKILYLDCYLGDYDHAAHLSNDESTQLAVIKRLDAKLGHLWAAIQASPMATETVLVLVSDHGMNSEPGIYSQGYNLVKFFNGREGGGHHVVTVRYPMTEYQLRSLDPFVSYVVTPSSESSYLRNHGDYPTVTMDPDGNERASIQLRNSDLNAIHILLLQLKEQGLDSTYRAAVRGAVLRIVEANRPAWAVTVAQLNEEMAALRRAIERQRMLIRADPKLSKMDFHPGLHREARRHLVTLDTWQTDERGYKEYARSLQRLLDLKESDLEPGRIRIESLIPKGVMGAPNSLYQLQNYVVGLSPEGIVLTAGGSLDLDRTFQRVNYFTALSGVRVRNLVQRDLGIQPVDFVAASVPRTALDSSLAPEDRPDSDAVFVSCDEQHEALLLSQIRQGTLWLRYLPVRDLTQDPSGAVRFTPVPWAAGFPLRQFEDPELRADGAWLGRWHTEREWFEAIHRTRYSNGVIGLYEYFQRAQPQPFRELAHTTELGSAEAFRVSDALEGRAGPVPEPFRVAAENDWPVLRRFAARRRDLVESDLAIFASDHWNFNVRGFNPGGNHGSFLRVSTHSVLMAAGSGVPEGLKIDRPYDSLSLVPTLLSLLGVSPHIDYPGPVIEEMTGSR